MSAVAEPVADALTGDRLARRNALVSLGYVVLSATAADVRDGAQVLAASVRAVQRRTVA